MPYWAIICIVGAVVWFLASTTLGGLIIAIGVILLLVELFSGGRRRYRI